MFIQGQIIAPRLPKVAIIRVYSLVKLHYLQLIKNGKNKSEIKNKQGCLLWIG